MKNSEEQKYKRERAVVLRTGRRQKEALPGNNFYLPMRIEK